MWEILRSIPDRSMQAVPPRAWTHAIDIYSVYARTLSNLGLASRLRYGDILIKDLGYELQLGYRYSGNFRPSPTLEASWGHTSRLADDSSTIDQILSIFSLKLLEGCFVPASSERSVNSAWGR